MKYSRSLRKSFCEVTQRMKNDFKSLLGALGLASRARKLTFGTELTCEAGYKGSLKLVVLSKEASQNTLKKVNRCCTENDIPAFIIDIGAEELSQAVGKRKPIMTLGVIDSEFKNLVQRTLADTADIKAFLQTYSESEV